jgi:predicted helicase
MKLEGHHFDTIEVIDETQVALNTLTEHDFQNAFKEMAEALGMVHTRVVRKIRIPMIFYNEKHVYWH